MSPRPPDPQPTARQTHPPTSGARRAPGHDPTLSATGIVSLSATARRPGSPFTHPPAGRWTGFICRPNQQRGRRPVSVARQARPAAHAATSVRGLPHQSDQRLGSGHRLGWWHRLRSRDVARAVAPARVGVQVRWWHRLRSAHCLAWPRSRLGLLSSAWPTQFIALACRALRHRHSRPAGSSVILSASLAVGLEGLWIRSDKGSVAFTGDGQPDHFMTAVVVLDERPDDDRKSALRGPHLGSVQGGCDLQDLHRRHGRRGHQGA